MQKVNLFHSVRLRVILIVCCLLWASMIFYMSGEPATESKERSGGIVETIITVIVPGYKDMPAEKQEEVFSFTDHVIRKGAHFSVYAALGALICLTSLTFSASYTRHLLIPLGISALYAGSDEFHQSLVPGRGPAFTDVLLDSAGALCGILLILLIAALILRRRKNKKRA